jgi:hypothetical protein
LNSDLIELHQGIRDCIGDEALVEEVDRRLRLTRLLADGRKRYIEIRRSDNEYVQFDVYTALFGEYESPARREDFDARTWGDLSFLTLIVKMFMAELCPPAQIPQFDPAARVNPERTGKK